jgi:hypothetical protein
MCPPDPLPSPCGAGRPIHLAARGPPWPPVLPVLPVRPVCSGPTTVVPVSCACPIAAPAVLPAIRVLPVLRCGGPALVVVADRFMRRCLQPAWERRASDGIAAERSSLRDTGPAAPSRGPCLRPALLACPSDGFTPPGQLGPPPLQVLRAPCVPCTCRMLPDGCSADAGAKPQDVVVARPPLPLGPQDVGQITRAELPGCQGFGGDSRRPPRAAADDPSRQPARARTRGSRVPTGPRRADHRPSANGDADNGAAARANRSEGRPRGPASPPARLRSVPKEPSCQPRTKTPATIPLHAPQLRFHRAHPTNKRL